MDAELTAHDRRLDVSIGDIVGRTVGFRPQKTRLVTGSRMCH
jgi:hypothetical protein